MQKGAVPRMYRIAPLQDLGGGEFFGGILVTEVICFEKGLNLIKNGMRFVTRDCVGFCCWFWGNECLFVGKSFCHWECAR